MDTDKHRSRLQENLLSLYLRLNGFFVSGFIVHSSEPGKNITEVDTLAIRHPYHCEPEREIGTSPFLETSNEFIDLLICEVKSRGQSLQFNDSMHTSALAIESILRWAGLFETQLVSDLALQVQSIFNDTGQSIPTVIHDRIRVRAILCSPERNKKCKNQRWFLYGDEIFSYIWQCFRPSKPRCDCATQYDFGLWGEEYEPIVRYFKERQQATPGTTRDLYSYLEV